MDYGDGKYPIGSGAYQFYPTYNRDEVCQQITDSCRSDRWYKLIPVPQCWFNY